MDTAGYPNRLRLCGRSAIRPFKMICCMWGRILELLGTFACPTREDPTRNITGAGREEIGKYRSRDSSQYNPGRSRGGIVIEVVL